jgi:hypothetical protein
MERYLFLGTVFPQRAQISMSFVLKSRHLYSGRSCDANVNIILNQMVAWIDSEHEWDIFDLRNIVISMVENRLAIVGYLKGFSYNLDVSRIICQSREIDYVFGIDIPCLAERGKHIDLEIEMQKICQKTTGDVGVLLHRCFTDLSAAMRHADDTAFYLYRAIESLRLHCAAVHGIVAADKAATWKKFREVSHCEENVLRTIKEAADPLRHGAPSGVTGSDREKLFMTTWEIVETYLRNL